VAEKLERPQGCIAITQRLNRATLGNFGDTKTLGDGVYEMRFFLGPGYRLYYTIRNGVIILLLLGGDKSSQEKDIHMAKKIADSF
jgi:putative addiction module killer protein